jgi:hypothetical protein
MRKFNQAAATMGIGIMLSACGASMLNAQAQQPATPQSAKPNKAAEVAGPDINQMSVAKQSSKVSVPIDVRYQISGAPSANKSVSVSLAFIPKVAGSDLRVEFPRSETVSVSETDEVMVQKADAKSVHRHNLVVTPTKGDAGEVRALVSMNVEGARYAGIFVIPVGPSAK